MRISDWSSDVCSSDLTVKFFNAMKGFGFIQRDDGQPDAFVHISAVERAGLSTLNEGDRLEFELEVDRRGKYAAVRWEERRVGKECVRTGRSRGVPNH